MIYFAAYYLIGVFVLWALTLWARSQDPNPIRRQMWHISYGKIMVNALIWPLVIIGAFF